MAKKKYEELERWDQISALLHSQRVLGIIAEVIPAGVDIKPESIAWSAIATIRTPQLKWNPKTRRKEELYPLVNCTDLSLVRATLHAASNGIEFGGPQPDCWLIPYGEVATFQMAAYGYITIARRAGIVKVVTDVIYESDKAQVIRGAHDDLVHDITDSWHLPGNNVPYGWKDGDPSIAKVEEGGRGRPLGAYVVATDREGNKHWDVVPESVCWEASKTAGERRGDTPWPEYLADPYVRWPDEMRKRTAITRARKVWPKEGALLRALQSDLNDKLDPRTEDRLRQLEVIQTQGQPVNGSAQEAAANRIVETARQNGEGASRELPESSLGASERLGVEPEGTKKTADSKKKAQQEDMDDKQPRRPGEEG
jgi:recombinational DNA repair protein RecT